ncbi:Nicotinamide phosphoribosyltransferase [hydrothermal vent metagenome]|uniref:Nicotinamide phosphoribosyltransferase n=1 Tax=hydrothermal vent metagenome TaxID=652676 RepID=A0A3B0Z0E0_9ZZZZ
MTNSIISSLAKNIVLNTDSYKVSHHLQYPPGTSEIFSYIESRGGRYPQTVFFGLQMFLKDYLSQPVTHQQIDQAQNFIEIHMPGVPFNEDGWRHIVDQHQGQLPIRIKAVPEGSIVPVSNVLVTVESLDPKVAWIAQHIEAALMRAVWYPTTVATQSWHIRQNLQGWLDLSADSDEGLPFMLHDFGARGVSSFESAAIGAAAHLVNFMGSDTIPGVMAAQAYYSADMPAFSIAASEHSTITSWGQENEVEAYQNMLAQFAKPDSVVAVVSDSYDIFHAVENIWGGRLKQQVIDSGATIVIRPDSGDPEEVVSQLLKIAHKAFGATRNSKGYWALNYVKIIQGDGVNEQSINAILQRITDEGYAADNLGFGMGGALLQQIDRDTQKFAQKVSAINVNGAWRDVYKDPVTDKGKRSKRGRLTLAINKQTGEYKSVRIDEPFPNGFEAALSMVYQNGVLTRETTFDEVRERAAQYTAEVAVACEA